MDSEWKQLDIIQTNDDNNESVFSSISEKKIVENWKYPAKWELNR